jgi:Tol biopolymer transport system component
MVRKFAIIWLLIVAASAYGQEEYFGQNKVQYKNLDWYYIQTHNFNIYFNQGQDTIAHFAAKTLEDAYKIISRQLDHKLTVRIPVIIYSSANDFQQTNVISDIMPEAVGGFTEVFKNRMVIPFSGSYEDFRHVLHHELTHAVVFNLLYGKDISNLIARQAIFSPPLWFAEGFAEYSSRKGWDYEADMFIRDAVISGYLPPLDQLYGFLDYKGGQSALIYIADLYGEELVPEILNKGKTTLSMNRAVKLVTGLEMKKLSDDWQKELRRVYWPDISTRKTADEIGKLITDHQKDGSIYNQNAAWSPRGDRIAVTSDRANPRDGFSDRFNEIYVLSAIDGRVIDKVVKAERSGDLESLHAYTSGISWAPQGDKLVFISKSHGKDALFFLDVDSKKIYKRFRPDLEAMRNPHWSHQGDKVVVSGMKAGHTDLYIYDIKSGAFTRLTNDPYEDIDAKFSPDGQKIAFTSDRPVSGTADSTYAYGHNNIFMFDLNQNTITPITTDSVSSQQPDFSYDGKMLAYVSYRNGIANLYLRDLVTGDDYPITDILTGAFAPSWSPEGDKIAFSAFDKYGYDIVVLKDIKPVNESKKLEPTNFRLTGKLYPDLARHLAEKTQETKPDSTVPPKEIDYSRYVFKADEEKSAETAPDTTKPDSSKKELTSIEAPLPQDTLKYLAADGSYKRSKYKPKFAPELMVGGFTYNTFYGLQGQSYISVTDLLGNHQFQAAFDINNLYVDQWNIQVIYSYLAKRLDYGIGAFHFKNLYYDYYNGYYFYDRLYGALGMVSYPFSKFDRLELNLTQAVVDREYDVDIPNTTTSFFTAGLSYVSDKVIWGIVGPVYGQRYKLTAEKSFKTGSSGYDFTSYELDYRKYIHFGSEYHLAVRLAGGMSDGDDARNYYLGGTPYWIGPEQKTEDIYSAKDIYVNKLILPLRGYRYFEFRGNNYFLLNMEARFPFIDYLKIRFPIGLTMGYIRGSLFWDMGAAWDDSSNFKFFDKDKGFPKLSTPKSGIGYSIQSNLGIFVLRYDTAWRTDLDKIEPRPRYYFSFGANF